MIQLEMWEALHQDVCLCIVLFSRLFWMSSFRIVLWALYCTVDNRPLICRFVPSGLPSSCSEGGMELGYSMGSVSVCMQNIWGKRLPWLPLIVVCKQSFEIYLFLLPEDNTKSYGNAWYPCQQKKIHTLNWESLSVITSRWLPSLLNTGTWWQLLMWPQSRRLCQWL